MRGLRLQSLMNIVALPAGFLVVDLHVERQGELALRKNRIEIGRQRAENMLAGFLAGFEIASFTKPQHHVEESELRISVGDRVMLASHRADADAAKREDAGLDRGLA